MYPGWEEEQWERQSKWMTARCTCCNRERPRGGWPYDTGWDEFYCSKTYFEHHGEDCLCVYEEQGIVSDA